MATATVGTSALVQEYRTQCPWCKQNRQHNMVLRRRPPTPKRSRSPKRNQQAKLPNITGASYGIPGSLMDASVSTNPGSVSDPMKPSVTLTEDRDVYQCAGCLHFSVRCRACSRCHARRGTPRHLRADTALPLPHSTHDPPPKLDDPEGVWEDDTCAVCDGSLVPGLAALLSPRLCSACVECSTHRYRRERPGLGIGPCVSVGGVKGSALGLGSRIDQGIDAHSTFQPLSSAGEGRWHGAAEAAPSVDVDGGGDYYACDRCGSHTVKCAGCDIGMAVVPENPKDYTALYGYPGGLSSASASASMPSASLFGTSSWYGEAGGPPLCALCSGYLATQEDLVGVLSLLSNAKVTLHVYIPTSDPSRRDYARLFAGLFGERLCVAPEEQGIPARDGVAVWPAVVTQHAGVFLPRAIPKAVYVDHPLRAGAVRLLVAQFHSLIAQEKCDDLVELSRALGVKSINPYKPKRKDSLDGSGSDKDKSDSDSDSGSDFGGVSDRSGGSSSDDDDARTQVTKRSGFGGANKSVVSGRGSTKGGPVVGPKSIKSAKSGKSMGGLSSVLTSAKLSVAGTPQPEPKPLSAAQLAAQAREAEAKAKAQAEADALDARITQWKLWMNSNSFSGSHAPEPPPANEYLASIATPRDHDPLSRRRTAQMTIVKRLPQPPQGKGWEPTVPDSLTWLIEESTWFTAIDGRVSNPTPATSSIVNITCMDSYGVGADLDALLLHPLLAPLCLQRGTAGAGAVERSFPILPSLPKRREHAPGLDPQPAIVPAMTYAQLVEVRTSAQRHAEARPTPMQFAEPFYPKQKMHMLEYWPFTPIKKKGHGGGNERPLPQSILDRMRVKKWLESGMNADPPMWALLKHPHL